MKILIQHTETGLYLRKGNSWADNPREALAFLDEVRARDHCIYRRLTKATVVVVPEYQSRERESEHRADTRSFGSQNEIEIGKMKPTAVKKSKSPKKTIATALAAAANPPVAKMTPAMPAPTEVAAKTAIQKPAAPARTDTVKPPQQQETVVTAIAAKIDVGFGNALFVRGHGDGLSWERGTPLRCVDSSTWSWTTTGAKDRVVFKLLLNDQVWSQGEDLTVDAGKQVEVVPVF